VAQSDRADGKACDDEAEFDGDGLAGGRVKRREERDRACELSLGGEKQGESCVGLVAEGATAAAMAWEPERRIKVSARLRRAAITCGPCPLRRRERSSPKVTSRT
jgi:hypothetical protein